MSAQGVWLVDGDDPVMVAERTRSLVAELLGGEDPSLALEDTGTEADLAAVVDACMTPPFLASRRVVVVRDVGARKAEEIAPLLAYLEDPSPTTSLVLVSGGERPPAKLVSAVKAHGQVVATRLSGREAGGWIDQRVKASGLRLDKPAVARLAAHLGEDVSRLPALLEVLVAVYGEGARVSEGDLEPYLGEAGGVAPWDLTDAIDAGNPETALAVLHRMLGAGQRHPLVVLATLHRHVQSMLRLDDPAIRTEAQAAQALGIPAGRSTYPAKKALGAAKRYGPAATAEAVGLVADAEVALKGATDLPDELILEILVARLCRLAGAGRR